MKLSEAAELLRAAGIENAKDEARTLFEAIGGIKRYMLVAGDAECDLPELTDAVVRRAAREPLQYIIGEVDFYNECYRVTPDCLIPRADTEILVDFAVKNIPRGALFLDLCTGSGCVAISVLANTEDTRAFAYDISEGALKLAKENAERNGVADRLVCERVDLLHTLPETKPFAVLSNPPYVAESVYSGLEKEIFSEPRCAFVGGADGGDFYRHFVPRYKSIIDKNGFMAFEIGYDQAALMKELAEQNTLSLEIIKDLSGNDRVAVLRLCESEKP